MWRQRRSIPDDEGCGAGGSNQSNRETQRARGAELVRRISPKEMIGASFNQYRITATLGAGDMGEVFRARDTQLNRDVAVKMLLKDRIFE
jgi:serine/threonine protein kinase